MKLLYRFVKWAFSRGTLPYWCIFAYDTLSVLVSGLFVYTLQYGVDNLYTNLNRVGLGIGLCMVLYMLAFFIFHTFNGVLRYSSFIDLRRVAYSSFTASIAICVFHQLQIRFGLSNYILVPRFVSGVQIFITATMLMWTARMAAKALHDLYNNFGISKNVFIYGALSGAVALARSIASDPRSRYKIKGFISDNEMMTSSRISGIKVYEDSPELVETMRKLHVQMLLVSPLQTERFTHDTKFIDALIAAKIKIMMMPPAEEWDGKSTISHTLLHEVDIEELLPRDKIEVDMEAIKKMLTGHRILITGAAGSIGSEMARLVATFKPSELILVDQAETPMHDVRLYMMNHHKDLKVWSIVGSITNESRMEQIFAAHKPEYVFHAAAYKHVPMMEDNPAMAIQNNVFGTRVIADLAVKYQTRKFVMISTDKAVNPTNVMGCSKRICEIYCLVLEAGTMGHGGEIFVFDMGDPVRIADLAQRMIELSGAKNVKIEYTGLRDGEKLYEEVLNDAEQTKPTVHPKIKVAAVREYSYKLARKNEMDLYDLSLQYDDMEIVRKMKEIVPEYKSRHSKYEVLDKK